MMALNLDSRGCVRPWRMYIVELECVRLGEERKQKRKEEVLDVDVSDNMVCLKNPT